MNACEMSPQDDMPSS